MATLDVSFVPECLEFSDSFQVMRRAETIGEDGRSSAAQVIATAIGTLYPTGDNALVRQSDFEHGMKTLTLVTSYRLQQAAPGYQPDVVLYRGNQYLVSSVEDFSQYGRGFVVAQLSSMLSQDTPPQ